MKLKRAIRTHTQLKVFKVAFRAAMRLFHLSKMFPRDEKYSLTHQIRRSSRSVCSNIAEAWRKRRYPAAFVSKLTDSESEAAETQTWIQFAVSCGYLDRKEATFLYKEYDAILGMLVRMSGTAGEWRV